MSNLIHAVYYYDGLTAPYSEEELAEKIPGVSRYTQMLEIYRQELTQYDSPVKKLFKRFFEIRRYIFLAYSTEMW